MSTRHRKSKFAIPGITPCCGNKPHDHRKKADQPKRPKKGARKPSLPSRGSRSGVR